MQCDIGNTCNDDDKGGVLRIQSGTSTALMINVIFEANIGNGAGNIFSTSSSAKLYLLNMPIPSEMVGITPIVKCDDVFPTTADFRSEDYTTGNTFVKGDAFNMVSFASCALTTTTTIGEGETLRIRGKDGLSHPELVRGGQANGDLVKVRAHHFVMNGDSALTLINLKLSGAWSGHVERTACNTGENFYCILVSSF